MSDIYLVTGAAGHLGGTIVSKLVSANKRVRALILPGETHVPSLCEAVFTGDVCDPASLEDFFAIPEGSEATVIHTAGLISIEAKASPMLRAVNVGGTKNVLDKCVEHKVKKLVHVSSVHAIPEKPKGETIREVSDFDPEAVIGGYAQTKAEASSLVLEAVRERGLDASIVHPSGICGPDDYGHGHITTLVTEFCNHRLTSAVRGGYDFVDVRDVANGIIECAALGRRGECYILSNRFFEIPEILGMLARITGNKPIRSFLPYSFVNFVAPLAEAYYKLRGEPPLFTKYSMYTLGSNAVFSHEKAARELGYKVDHTMEQTLADTISFLREHGRIS